MTPSLLGLNNHRMELSSTKEEVSFGHGRFEVCIRYPNGVEEQAIYYRSSKFRR